MSSQQNPAQRLLIILGALMVSSSAADSLLLDDFAVAGESSRLGTPWRLVTDGVMGGVSTAEMSFGQVDGRRALCLRGDVRLENNGGFVQAALDLAPEGNFDASPYTGIRILVRGNGEAYNLHLKTSDLRRPWQSYRSRFHTTHEWREMKLPFSRFKPHRVDAPLDTRRLRSLGLVAIGRAFSAKLCVAEVGLYRDPPEQHPLTLGPTMDKNHGSEWLDTGGTVLRPAVLDDLERINALIGRAVMTWALPERVKRLARPSYHYDRQDLEHLRILVAEEGAATLIGVTAWESAEARDCPGGQRGLLLHGLYVDPDRQGLGLGSRLLAAAASAARDQRYDGLLVKAQTDARGFFQARGLEPLACDDPERDYPSRFWMDLADAQCS